jgi:hypothetical protein
MARSISSATTAMTLPVWDTTQAQARTRERLLPCASGRWNPRDCMVAVIDDVGQAWAAIQALCAAEFAEADVYLAQGHEIVAHDEAWRGRGLLARLIAGIGSLGDEGLIASEYVAEARRGHHVLIVHAPGDARMWHAWALLARYQAHTVHYFGRWVIRDL